MGHSKRRNSAAARRRRREAKRLLETPAKASFSQARKYGGLLVTKELEKALDECKLRVEEIASDCRKKNRKFRDIEFDLENDRQRCLYGLMPGSAYNPSDVQRVTQIFDKPSFFIDGANSNDIVQGALGDCWFLSALATMSTAQALIEKFCVARDEQVGVYGFIFFRDAAWVVVIVDDLLFTSIPKFEELNQAERQLYHNDKDLFNRSARKSGKSLYFAKSGTQGETWVPLIEKAYAKLHGGYAALAGGEVGEAIEDLTGGVSTFIMTKDILDVDLFWKEELSRANVDRLFGCAFDDLDKTRSGETTVTVNGLFGSHSYSVLRAVEFGGKRFVVIRNPWGRSEWTGPWSDGSKEWSPEWLPALASLGHTFGDDGEFVMEYGDFLENWEQIDRIKLFDWTWVMSSQWLEVTARPARAAWSFGDVSFTISIPAGSPAVIVLSQLDPRYFEPIAGRTRWNFDFLVFRKGEKKPITSSSQGRFWSRSVNTEVELEAGEYIVHVRLDREIDEDKDSKETVLDDNQVRCVSRTLTEMARSQSIVSNINKREVARHLPIPLSVLAGQDLSELEAKAKTAADALKREEEEIKGTRGEFTSEPEVIERRVRNDEVKEDEEIENDGLGTPEKAVRFDKKGAKPSGDDESINLSDYDSATEEVTAADDEDSPSHEAGKRDSKQEDSDSSIGQPQKRDEGSERNEEHDDDLVIYLGLRVYTKKDAPAVVGGQLRHEMAVSFDGLAIDN